MARIVLISPYLKGGQNAAKLAQRTRYVATRPGVELLADERSTLPATKKQQDFIARLLKSFPSCWELIEYEEYLDHPTQVSASAFIQQVQEDYMEALEQKEMVRPLRARRRICRQLRPALLPSPLSGGGFAFAGQKEQKNI